MNRQRQLVFFARLVCGLPSVHLREMMACLTELQLTLPSEKCALCRPGAKISRETVERSILKNRLQVLYQSTGGVTSHSQMAKFLWARSPGTLVDNRALAPVQPDTSDPKCKMSENSFSFSENVGAFSLKPNWLNCIHTAIKLITILAGLSSVVVFLLCSSCWS